MCNEETDACEAQPVADGTACVDELFCTVSEVRTAGVCGGSPRDCSASGDQCNIGTCNEKNDTCQAQPIADGTACDDGDPCHVGETCQGGQCSGGASQDCLSAGDQCNTASYNPDGAEGNCVTITPVVDGTECDDGLFCTQTDTCLVGVCDGSGNPCAQLCDDVGDLCVECFVDGQCDDGVVCTEESCVEGGCVSTPNDGNCPDNGSFCDGTEFRDSLLDCQSTGDPCPADKLCNEDTDTCGECITDGDCDDGVVCTDHGCVKGGCVYIPNDANCPDDDFFCNGTEVCDAVLACSPKVDPAVMRV